MWKHVLQSWKIRRAESLQTDNMGAAFYRAWKLCDASILKMFGKDYTFFNLIPFVMKKGLDLLQELY